MTTTLNKLLVAVALSSLAVIACDKPRGTKMAAVQSEEFAEHSNIRCVLVDEQGFCVSSRMREPIQQASFSAI